MNIRIKFAKSGIARFIGHLDVMRYFQKALRRGGIAIRYSSGFSPHQLMSFAAPLGVGITSSGEYLDIEVEDQEDIVTMKERLNQVMAEGFYVCSCHILPEKAGNAMSLVAAARYILAFRPDYAPPDSRQWFRELMKFYSQERVEVLKKTKKGEKKLNLKDFIYELSVSDGGVTDPTAKPALAMMISAGSTENIKPELVLDAYFAHLGQERPAFAFYIHREEVYAKKDPENKGPYQVKDFLPLEAFGRNGGCLE